MLESRALLRAFEVLASTCGARGCRVLALSDNMSVALSFERRRSRNYKVLVCIRRAVALSLALNIKLYVRWLPSEANPTDRGSRFFDPTYDASKTITTLLGAKQGDDFGDMFNDFVDFSAGDGLFVNFCFF